MGEHFRSVRFWVIFLSTETILAAVLLGMNALNPLTLFIIGAMPLVCLWIYDNRPGWVPGWVKRLPSRFGAQVDATVPEASKPASSIATGAGAMSGAPLPRREEFEKQALLLSEIVIEVKNYKDTLRTISSNDTDKIKSDWQALRQSIINRLKGNFNESEANQFMSLISDAKNLDGTNISEVWGIMDSAIGKLRQMTGRYQNYANQAK